MHFCSLLQRAMLRRAATPLAVVQDKLDATMGAVEVRGHRLAEQIDCSRSAQARCHFSNIISQTAAAELGCIRLLRESSNMRGCLAWDIADVAK